MLTDLFYIQLATLLRAESQSRAPLQLAIGRGAESWDRTPPILRRQTTVLHEEVARKPVDPAAIDYLNREGGVSTSPTPRLRFHTRFTADEGSGTLRECGLLLGEGRDSILLAYFIHPRVEKLPEFSIDRSIQLDLTPGRMLANDISTRYLGNSSSEEIHDLENEQAACQIEEIRVDRRHYFNSIEEALTIGYDHCAYCFGRELSQR